VSGAYSRRTTSGQIVHSYKPNLGMRGEFVPSTKILGKRCKLSTSDEDFENVGQKYRFMYTSVEERVRSLDKHLLRLQKLLCQSAGVDEGSVTAVGTASQDCIWVCGRICCESSEGRLNKASVTLEGSVKESGGRRIQLDLSTLETTYSLFPGQIVLIYGLNSGGRVMNAKRIVCNIQQPVLSSSPAILKEYHHGDQYQRGSALNVMMACGPFSTSDNLSYQPLQDLLMKVLSSKPDVLVLSGPFVDISHPLLSSGDVVLDEEDEDGKTVAQLNASYEMVFAMRVIRDCLSAMFKEDENLPTNVVIIPSLNDAHHEFVFPQPPFGDREEIKTDFFEESLGILNIPFSKDSDPRKRIHLLSNPCMFRYGVLRKLSSFEFNDF
jgi:DNA polymerase alpha subunit B